MRVQAEPVGRITVTAWLTASVTVGRPLLCRWALRLVCSTPFIALEALSMPLLHAALEALQAARTTFEVPSALPPYSPLARLQALLRAL